LLSVVRLPWAQEAPGSNPGAPTTFITHFEEVSPTIEINEAPNSDFG
jgi:hypothetical protein